MLREIKDCANRLINLLNDCCCEEIEDYVCSEVCSNGFVDIDVLEQLVDKEET